MDWYLSIVYCRNSSRKSPNSITQLNLLVYNWSCLLWPRSWNRTVSSIKNPLVLHQRVHCARLLKRKKWKKSVSNDKKMYFYHCSWVKTWNHGQMPRTNSFVTTRSVCVVWLDWTCKSFLLVPVPHVFWNCFSILIGFIIAITRKHQFSNLAVKNIQYTFCHLHIFRQT